MAIRQETRGRRRQRAQGAHENSGRKSGDEPTPRSVRRTQFEVLQDGSFLELVRDPKDGGGLAFLHWDGRQASIRREFEHQGELLLPPELDPTMVMALRLPHELGPSTNVTDVFTDIGSLVDRCMYMPFQSKLLASAYALATWFVDRLPVAPYLSIVGPLNSGKTRLLSILHVVCRRPILAGEISRATLQSLPGDICPTLLCDEAELGHDRLSRDLERVLRTGNVPGVHTLKQGKALTTYCAKAFCSRQPFGDAALSSRMIRISVSPAQQPTPDPRPEQLASIARPLQAKLLRFRLDNYHQVQPPAVPQALTPRGRDLARALAAPLFQDPQLQRRIIELVESHDEQGRLERQGEPEWLVVDHLFVRCHLYPLVLVGTLAEQLNRNLKEQGDIRRLSAKRVGLILSALGIPRREGRTNAGYVVDLEGAVKLRIHELARSLGILRQPQCPLCGMSG